ncbi:NlpC/P60 family protein [Shewanella sp. YIC-542]|uniref:NlpC/P60 family protein n=1 Tax=Shewanella mytili TaxID=3377111 RepID=UPI00398F4C65
MQCWQALIILTLLGGLAACSTVPSSQTTAQLRHANHMPLSSGLQAIGQEWQGVPYRLGGMNKKGIDCSAFVSMTYQRLTSLMLPRTVAAQQQLGVKVPKHQMQVGDLLFFKTGWRSRHVGIYLGNHEFLHASTSQGVMVSSLDNPYWQQTFWQARRLL